MEMKRFNDRCAVVTGAASGIGLAVAKRLVAEGARVVLWDRDAAGLEKAAQQMSGASSVAPIDLTDAAAVEQRTQEAIKSLGKIDVLVASAGIAGPNATTWEYPIDAWKQVFDVNVNGVFFCDRAIVPHMMSRGYGRIVHMASIAGKEGNPNAPAYSASKAAVIGLTKSLGKELAKTGITVNCVTPATVDTPILKQVTPQFVEYMRSKIPMGRFGTVDEVASLVCWLASEECSFTTGGVFDISGGRATY